MRTLKISSRQYLFVFLWIGFILCLALFPYLHNYILKPEGKKFQGALCLPYDQNTYLALIQQASEGKTLFTNPFTSEKQKTFFRPFWLILGSISHLLHTSPIIVCHIATVFFAIILLITIYFFLLQFFPDAQSRSFCFMLSSISSGISWLLSENILNNLKNTYNIFPQDLVEIESNNFLVLTTNPEYGFAIILLLFSFYFAVKAVEKNSVFLSFCGGASAFILGFVHTHDLVTLFATLLIFFAILSAKKPSGFSGYFRFFFLIVLFGLPGIFYHLHLYKTDEVFQKSFGAPILTASPFSYVLGWGGLILFALMAVKKLWKEKNLFYTLLLSWLLAVPLILYAPVSMQRRFSLGYHVALSIAGTIGIFSLFELKVRSLHGKPFLKPIEKYKLKLLSNKPRLLLVIFLFLIPSNLLMFYNFTTGPKKDLKAYFLPENEISALSWTKENISTEKRVLSSFTIGNYLPRITGGSVLLGASPWTINLPEKLPDLRKFFSKETSEKWRLEFCKKHGITHIYYGSFEKEYLDYPFGSYKSSYNPADSSFLKKLYDKNGVEIFKPIF